MWKLKTSGITGCDRVGVQWGVAILTAIALIGLPSSAAAQADGAQVFSTRCAACHQANGAGIPGAFPPLAGSEIVNGDAGIPIRILLHGLQGEVQVEGEVFSGMMPAWGPSLDDDQIAAVLTYVRSNFGNKAAAVTADQVAKLRAATADQKAPWTIEELRKAAAADKPS